MPYAIAPRGVGEEPGARRIAHGASLKENEAFQVEAFEPGMILAADGQSLEIGVSREKQLRAVEDERDRRLSLGFDFQFEDDRGLHRIGTTKKDMIGWNEVINCANALVASGDEDTIIDIVTDTGETQVTAPEWQAIMLEAAVVRQKIWSKSSALQKLNPVPQDFADDRHWA